MEILERTTIATDAGELDCCIWQWPDTEGRLFAVMRNRPDGTPIKPINGWVESPEQAIENMIEDCRKDD